MKRLFSILIILLFVIFGVAVAIVNTEPVKFNYYYGTTLQPLSVLLLGAFGTGMLISMVFTGLSIMGLKSKLRKAQRMLLDSENKITVFQGKEK